MRKLLTLCAAFSLFMFSCKKEKTGNTPAKNGKVEVTFKVSAQFTGTKSPISTQSLKKNNELSPVNTEFLTVLFYDFSSVLYKRIDQKSSQPDFGTIKVELPQTGNYRVFFIAAADSSFNVSVEKHSDGHGSTFPFGVPVLTYPNTIFPPNGDIFTLEQDIRGAVSANYELELKRAVSQVTVTLSDVLPVSAVKNNLNILNLQYSTGLDLVSGKGYIPFSQTGTHSLPPAPTFSDVAKTGFTRTFFMWPSQNTFIKISNGDFVSADISVPDGEFMANQQYTFKGFLFPVNNFPHNNVPSAFDILVNSDWNAPITVPISTPAQ